MIEPRASEREKRVRAIAQHAARRQQKGGSITVRDVMELFGLTSTSTAHVWLRRAVSDGVLTPSSEGRHGGFRLRGPYACPCCGGTGAAADAAGIVTVKEDKR